MKVLPQKKPNKPKYPVLKDAVKTAATLALTTSTLVGVTSCDKDSKVGKLIGGVIESQITKPTEDLGYAGEQIDLIPEFVYNEAGDIIELDYLYPSSTISVELDNGCDLYIEGNCRVILAKGIRASDVDENSPLATTYPLSFYDYYDTVSGDLYIVSKNCDHYVEEEIILAGDVAVVEGSFNKYEVMINSKTAVMVDDVYYPYQVSYDIIGGGCLSITDQDFAMVDNITLANIDDDSEFYEVFSKDEYVFFETTSKTIIIVSKDASYDYEEELLELGGVAAPEDIGED